MRKIYFILLIACSVSNLFGQTFSSSTGTIASSSTTCFDVLVSGVGNINGTFGIESICLDMDAYGRYSIVTAVAPDGTIIYLSYENGDFDPFGNVCFDMTATTNIRLGTTPFSGNYLPQESIGIFNSQNINADGIWQICVENGRSSSANLNSGSITFGNSPALSCGARATDDECSPPMICNVVGYCGTTLPTYTASTVPTSCGYTIQNNSFVKFIASLNIATLTVDIFDCEVAGTPGVQMEVFQEHAGI
jgi:hypothetical protein